MTSFHFDPHGRLKSQYGSMCINARSNESDQRQSTIRSSSIVSGLKSMFSSRKAAPSISASSMFDYQGGTAISRRAPGAHGCSASNHCSDNYSRTLTFYEREEYTQKRKTSDSFPNLTHQLEDRMLQLADRSRRLGVHRFSRTRNALVLNQHSSTTLMKTQHHHMVSRSNVLELGKTGIPVAADISASASINHRKESVSLPRLTVSVRE
jgi:hypothetical protein